MLVGGVGSEDLNLHLQHRTWQKDAPSFPSFRSSRHCFILVCKLGDFSNITMKFVSIFICIKVIVFQEFHYQLNVHFKNLDLHFPI